MVIKMQYDDYEIKRLLISTRSLVKAMYWDAFEGPNLDPNELHPLRRSLVSLYRE